jgi:hypothetical protein
VPGIIGQSFFDGNDQPRVQIRGSGLQRNAVERGILVLQDARCQAAGRAPRIQYSGMVGRASDMAVRLLAFALGSSFDPQTRVLSAETSHGWIVDSRRWLREIAQCFDVLNLDYRPTHSHPVGNECHK